MFDISSHRAIIKDLHKIESNRFVLLSDGENDLIISGTNKYGNRILGSIIGEEDLEGFLRYFQILVNDKTYYEFLNKKISLLKIIKESEAFFVVDYDYNYVELRHALYSFEDFPKAYLPLENSFCPTFVKDPSMKYTISLKGGHTDIHLAKPEDLNLVNQKFSDFLRSSTLFVEDFNLKTEVYVEALKVGSFEIKFRLGVESPQQTSVFPVNIDEVEEYVKEFYSYILNELPNEENDIFRKEIIESKSFNDLKSKLKSIYSTHESDLSNVDIQKKILKTIKSSIHNIKEILHNKSFNRIEFKNVSKTGEEIPIALIDESYIDNVSPKIYGTENTDSTDLITSDNLPQSYKIQVYQFNIDTGKGSAYIQQSEDSILKIKLNVLGKVKYQKTPFTLSLDKGKIIEVSGIAKKINGEIKEITYQY